jgi:predicted transcriptional regulator
MKVTRIITTILVSVSMTFILACSAEQTVSLEGSEDIAAGIQKLAECYDNPETTREIYAENAVLKWQDRETAQIREQKGLTEIEKYYKERGENFRVVKVSISDIQKSANNAHVEYQLISEDRKATLQYNLNGSSEMVKQGPGWKIKEEIVKQDLYD